MRGRLRAVRAAPSRRRRASASAKARAAAWDEAVPDPGLISWQAALSSPPAPMSASTSGAPSDQVAGRGAEPRGVGLRQGPDSSPRPCRTSSLGRSMARMRRRNCARVSGEGAGGAGAAVMRVLLRRGGIREDRKGTRCVRPDVFTKASASSLGGGHGSGDGVSRGWTALAMADARNGVQNTHATHDVLVLFLAPSAQESKDKKNRTRTKIRVPGNKSPCEGQRIALRLSQITSSVGRMDPPWPRNLPLRRPAERARRLESDHRMLKPWTTHTYFRTCRCKFVVRCGRKALTSHRTVRIYEAFTIPTLTIGFGTLEGETADPSLSIRLE